MPNIVGCHTVVHPWTMAFSVSTRESFQGVHVLIKFRDTAAAPSAMFTSQRHSQHAMDAEILLIVFPKFDQFFDNRLLLTSTSWLRNETRVLDHTISVKICAQAICE